MLRVGAVVSVVCTQLLQVPARIREAKLAASNRVVVAYVRSAKERGECFCWRVGNIVAAGAIPWYGGIVTDYDWGRFFRGL